MNRRFSAACFLAALVVGSAAVTIAVAHPSGQSIVVSSDQGPGLIASEPGLSLVPTSPAAPRGALQVKVIAPAVPHVVVPILMYHYIRIDNNPKDRLGWQLSVPPAIFKQQMDWLRIAGGHTVTLEQVVAALHGGPKLPAHSVVLTFDDGYDDFATVAAPVMAADGFIGTTFVNTGLLDRPSYMTVAQVQQVADMGMVVGDHTVNHVDLNALPPASVRNEIDADRATLEALIERPVLDFAYPYGDFDATVVDIVASQGFRDAVTTQNGDVEWLNQLFTLPRIRVGGGDTVWSFARKAGIAVPPAGWVDPTP